MLYFAWTCRIMTSMRFDTDEPGHLREERVHGDGSAGGDVENPAGNLGGSCRPQIGVDHVVDEREVARLLAIPVNDRGLAEVERAEERGNDSGVRRSRVLPRPEHIEVAQGDGLQPIEAREHGAELLS